MKNFKNKFEIYKGNHNKTFIVTDLPYGLEIKKEALKHFKCAKSKIIAVNAFIVGDDLYLDYPSGISDSKIKRIWVAYKR